MLSEEKKLIIEQEEIYRNEIQTSLECQRFKWLKIVNAPITIFLMSSILISLVTWIYSNWEKSNIKSQKNSEQVLFLETEIEYRLNHIKAINKDNVQGSNKLLIAHRATRGGLGTGWLLPKFKDHSLIALASLLEKSIRNKNKDKYKKFRENSLAWSELLNLTGHSSDIPKKCIVKLQLLSKTLENNWNQRKSNESERNSYSCLDNMYSQF